MAFQDYSITSSANTTMGDSLFVGPNMPRDNVRPALQQLMADGKALANDVALAAFGTNLGYYASTAAGIAATDSGEFFAVVPGAGLLVVYLNSAGTAVEQTRLGQPGQQANLFDWIPANLHNDITNRTLSEDLSGELNEAALEISNAGGGTLLFPDGLYNGNMVLQEGVKLWNPSHFGYGPGALFGAQLNGVTSGWVIDTPAVQTLNCAVEGINVQGLGAGTSLGGIRFQNVRWGKVSSCQFNNFAEQGFLQSAGWTMFEDLLVLNCLLDRSRGAKAGALELHGSDHSLRGWIECTASQTTVSDANLYLCGILIAASNCEATGLVGEVSDIGVYVSGSLNKFSSCRADLNLGHGWEIVGGGNTFASCHGISNSQDTTDTYDNWRVTAGNNSFSACQSSNVQTKKTKYGFNDTVASGTVKNYYDASCFAVNAVTANWNVNNDNGSARQTPMGPFRTFADGDATPSVADYGNWRTANTGATLITNFDDGITGQTLELFCLDDFTTLVHNGAQLSLLTSANKKLVNGATYVFRKQGAVWREIGARPLKATATVDPASLATGASTTIATITVTGAAMGNMVDASFSQSLAGARITAWVSAADTVSYFFTNVNGTNPLDLASGTLAVHVRPQ